MGSLSARCSSRLIAPPGCTMPRPTASRQCQRHLRGITHPCQDGLSKQDNQRLPEGAPQRQPHKRMRHTSLATVPLSELCTLPYLALYHRNALYADPPAITNTLLFACSNQSQSNLSRSPAPYAAEQQTCHLLIEQPFTYSPSQLLKSPSSDKWKQA